MAGVPSFRIAALSLTVRDIITVLYKGDFTRFWHWQYRAEAMD